MAGVSYKHAVSTLQNMKEVYKIAIKNNYNYQMKFAGSSKFIKENLCQHFSN